MQVLSDYTCAPLLPPWGWEALLLCYPGTWNSNGDFAGAYHVAYGSCVEGNPAAGGACNCPAGTQRVEFPVTGDCWNQETVAMCFRPGAPRTRFAGAYFLSTSVYDGDNGCITANPLTGACTCPAGSNSIPTRAIYGQGAGCFPVSTNVAWLHTCYVP
jgi:hypothetical protein